MAEFDGISEFVKSGPRRLRDAEELLEVPSLAPTERGADTRHLRGAMYLAGYAVECLLKAYIISRQTGCMALSEARDAIIAGGRPIRDICGAAGHQLEYLLSLTDLEAGMDRPMRQDLSLCAKWRSSWRYDPKPARREDAEALVESARRVMDWIRTRI